MTTRTSAASALIIAACCAPAFAQVPVPLPAPDPSGTAVRVLPAAHAKGPGGDRVLAAEKPVFGGDVISTGEKGQAQIVFRDETRLVVGPDSDVTIDRFVVADGGGAGGAALEFTKGAFRFITGGGASDSYTLETPTASIGIRGTKFDIAVGSEGTAVVVFQGAVEVCSRVSGECRTIRRSCSAIVAHADGRLDAFTGADPRAGLIDRAFPLAAEQKTLRKDFRVWTGRCGLGGNDPRGGGGNGSGSRGKGSRGGGQGGNGN